MAAGGLIMVEKDVGLPCPETERRSFLKTLAVAATGFILPSSLILPAEAKVKAKPSGASRRISLVALNNSDRFDGIYWENGRYLPDAQRKISHLMRDSHNGQIHKIDPHLFDQLWELSRLLNLKEPFQVVCGYRSPTTNALARRRSSGVAKKSLHMSGRAIDIRLAGRSVSTLSRAARSMKAGGVGYYPKSNFIHIDTGAVRTW